MNAVVYTGVSPEINKLLVVSLREIHSRHYRRASDLTRMCC